MIKIALISYGYLPNFIDFNAIKRLDSKAFEVTKYEEYALLPDSDTNSWAYSDSKLHDIIPSHDDVDFTIAVVNSPVEGNYFIRRISNNRVVVTLFQAAQILQSANVPLENYILRTLYKYAIVYKRFNKIPIFSSTISHHETRVCLFDMTPIKTDIVHSTEKLGLCEECRTKFKQDGVPSSFLETIEKEIKSIKKDTYYRIVDFVRRKPILAIVISLATGLIINLVSSILFKFFFENFFE